MPVATQMSRFLPRVMRTPSQVVNTLVPRSSNWIAWWSSPPVGPIRDAIIQMTASQQPYTPSPVQSVPATIAGSGTCVDCFRDGSLNGTFALLPLVHTISVNRHAQHALLVPQSPVRRRRWAGRHFAPAIAIPRVSPLQGFWHIFVVSDPRATEALRPGLQNLALSGLRTNSVSPGLSVRQQRRTIPECRLRVSTLRASPIRRPVAFMALKGPDSIAQGAGRRSSGYCHAYKKSKALKGRDSVRRPTEFHRAGCACRFGRRR